MKIYQALCAAPGSCFVLLAALCISSAASQTRPFIGRIIDHSTRTGVDGAVVKIRETGTQLITDSAGFFRIVGFTSGRYTLTVRHIAYAGAERVVVAHAAGSDLPSFDILIELRPVLLPSDEVIIRSTRTSSAARGVPFPLECVANGGPLLHAPVTISDVIAKTSGAFLVRDGAWETAVSIRGMSRSNIVMLVDDTRIETANDIAGALSLVDTEELDRVEVLRSPGSSLYGSGAIGGVIHMVTKRPSFRAGMRTGLDVTEGMTSVDGGLSHHLAFENAGDAHALRLSGGYRKAGNTMTPAGALPNSRYSDFSLAGTLGIKTIGSQSLFISYQRTQAEDTGIPGGAPIAASAAARYLLARRELISLDYTMPNISPVVPLLTVKLSRQVIDRNVEIIQSPDVTLTPHATHAAASIQIESKLTLLPNAVLTLGAEAWQRNLDSKRERMYTSTDLLIGERPIPSSSYFSGGAYAHNEWHAAADRVSLVLGARYDWIRVSNDDGYTFEYRRTSMIDDRIPPTRQLLWKKNSSHDESWSANAGAVYALTSSVNLSCLAAAAYRSPSLEERFQFIDLGSLVRVGDPALHPEKSASLNAGINLQTELITMQADLFFNRLTDLITEIPGTFEGRAALVKTNIGEARLYGFEFSCGYAPAPWVSLTQSISCVRGEDTRAHANLPQIAPLNGRVAAAFALRSLGTADLSSSYAFTQELTAAGELRTPGYAVVDADVSSEPVPLGRTSFTVRAGIHNMFDKAYRSHLSTLRGLNRLEPGSNIYLTISVNV
jgi:hemoglobin/transferrin/lactoferrin receptor protein